MTKIFIRDNPESFMTETLVIIFTATDTVKAMVKM